MPMQRRSLSTAVSAAVTCLLVGLLPVASGQGGSLNLPPCSSLPPGTASRVPTGWSAEEWRGMLSDAYASQGQDPIPLCQSPPPQGAYALTNPVPEQQLDNIGYTQRDWARWDGFDLATDLLYTPSSAASNGADANDAATRVWGIGNGGTDKVLRTAALDSAPLSKSASSIGSPLSADNYKRVLRWKLESWYLPHGYSVFRWFGNDPTLDYIEVFKSSTARWDVPDVLMNVSFAINENYNSFRASKRAAIKTKIVADLRAQGIDPLTRPVDSLIDAQWDATSINWLSSDMPRNQATFDWYERYLQTVMGKQMRTKGQVFVQFNGKPYDVYGCFEGYDGAGYQPVLMFFYSHDFAYMAARWVKLLRSPIIRQLRGSMQASLAAQWSAWSYKLGFEDRLLSQWFLRLAGFSTSAYFMMRSEAVLRARGEWTAADDITTTDWSVGRVVTADLLAQCETWTKKYVSRLENLGASEYASTYYGVTFDYYEPAMLMAPSPAIYALYERIVKMLWFDLASSWSPGSAAFTAATGRHYDVTTSLHSRSDYWDIPLYLSQLHAPLCAQSVGHTRWDGVKQTEVVNLCTEGAATLAPMTRLNEYTEFSIIRFQFAAAQAAGFYYLPFDAFVNISLASPIRTHSALTTSQLQGMRFTFHTPSYALGFGADDAVGHGLTQVHVGRLPGVPVPGSAVAVLKQAAVTQVHAQCRQMTECADDPFWREGTLWGVISHEIPQVGRMIIAQHQGYQLLTSRVSGFTNNQGSDAANPWNTDLLFPVTTDGLYADGTPLPVTEGTVIALPLSTIFLVKHGNSAFAVRILRLETSAASGIKHATTRTTLSNAAAYAPTKGLQEYSVTWVVDASSLLAGSGRVVLHHKHRGDSSSGSWKVSTLWAGGRTRTMAEAFALQRSLRHAEVTETITPNAAWDPTKQSWTSGPAGWNGFADLGEEEWSTEVHIGASVQLKVRRTDAYNPWAGLAAYQHDTAPVQMAPYYVKSFDRMAQGVAMFPEFAGATLTWNKPAIQTKAIDASALLEPHLTEPRDCIPGVDFPCYRWNPTDWGACSVSCKSGTHTRSVRCVDASNSNSLASSTSLCPATQPVVQESCNMGPCFPGVPTITKVQALDGFIEVWFNPPADDGGDATTPAGPLSYVVVPSPADVGTTGSASPIKLGPLTNGRSYTIRIAAINKSGTGALSASTAPVVPDSYRWAFDPWGGCDSPCNGGTQHRTYKCVGAATGAADPSKCTDPVPTTELTQACNVQSCVWQPTAWSACSSECSGGTQTRTAPCSSGIQSTGGRVVTVDPWWCRATAAPATSQACNTQACKYQLTEWSTCSKTCGSGTQTRQVTCYNGAGDALTLAVCSSKIGAVPATSQACNTQACLPNQWVANSWSTCDQLCGGGVQTRSITCKDASGNTLASTECPASSAPTTQRECNTAACVWKADAFGACSTPCGGGTQVRTVSCADALGTEVSASRCQSTPPASSGPCNTQVCTWVPGPWSNCSAPACGTGVRTRSGQCTDGAVQVLPVEKCASVPFESSMACSSTESCIGAPAPVTVTKVVALDGSALIYFDAPPPDGSGETPTYYAQVEPVDEPGAPPIASGFEVGGAVAIPQMGAMTAYGTSSPIEVIGLTNGRSYRFSVVSVNSAGSGAPSISSAVVTPYPPPGVPTIGTIIPGDGELNINFTPAALAPGEPASSFQAWAIAANDTSSISSDMLATEIQRDPVVSTSSPLTIGSLDASTLYVIAMRAVSPSGHSDVVLSDRGHYPDAAAEPVVGATPFGRPVLSESSGSSSSSSLAIALGVVIPLLFLLGLAAGAYVWHRRRQGAKLETSSTDITREVSQVHTTWPHTEDNDADTEAQLTAMSPSPSPSPSPDAPALSFVPTAVTVTSTHKRISSQIRIDMDGSIPAPHPAGLLSSPLASPSIDITGPSGGVQSYAPIGRDDDVPTASPGPPLPAQSPSLSPTPSPPPARHWGGVVQRWQAQ